MELPLQISFRDIPRSDAVEAYVRERAALLERFARGITRCRTVIALRHRHHHQGRLFQVRLEVTLPGAELVVGRTPDLHHAHEDVYVALRDAFDAMERQLEDFVRLRRGDRKSHAVPPHGRVVKLLPGEDYGFIRGADGTELYFHRNSVVDGRFEDLHEGEEVRFVVEEGEKGPQASTVVRLGKRHPPAAGRR